MNITHYVNKSMFV